ncbi:GNAT family N-acetyltransferase [Paenibacillus spongiae]|uniref:GNAT family N-acetyltransferase n=1 Tax=Paenibacillus spongiae TaxID=2909671 RepID=A0ABY5SFC7_9BACL|nr:GNAT family N-acetyltransferase [Paenibacillus spongiae]UVI32681.1 GNAT family N-acetyltransferase [Paenibacillus spongiae]
MTPATTAAASKGKPLAAEGYSQETGIQLYDRHIFHDIKWPDTEAGSYAKRYLLPLLSLSTDDYIANARTELYVLVMEGLVFPLTVNDNEYDNSYVCSPYTHYVSYAEEELNLLHSRILRGAISGLLSCTGLLLKASKINKIVHFNNWLLSTNLYADLSDDQAAAVLRFLKKRFPTHAIVFRSLNATTTASLLETLRRESCRMVPSRQIYLLRPHDPASMNAKSRWLVKRDYALLHKHGYDIMEPAAIEESDLPRIVELYNALYLHKYSFYNPQFQESFIRLAWEQGTLSLYGLRKNGRLDAVLGFFCRDGVMTTPLFGYDTTLPQQLGLYRMLSAVLLRIAAENGLLLHESSGAAQFKRNRGAAVEIEYSAVYDKHLPFYRRSGWMLLSGLLEGIGVPLIRRLKL